MTAEAYKDHRAGSAKGKVHKIFDKDGPEAAIKLAVKLGKAETTARTWCSEWRNTSATKKSKKSAKASARKPVAKKAKTSAKKPAKKAKAVKRERIAENAAA